MVMITIMNLGECIYLKLLQFTERRILGLFPFQLRRQSKRDVDSYEHGHDFVSADGALVTICFLTFSVFLIKLVLVSSLTELPKIRSSKLDNSVHLYTI